jgi:hypothetical protein
MTPSEIRTANEMERLVEGLKASPHASILDQFPVEKTAVGIKVGPIEVMPGANPDKPVIRDAKTKHVLEGTGPHKPKEKEPEKFVTPVTEFRKSVQYREAFEALFPAGGDVDERGSLAWWFDKAWMAAEGSPQLVDCQHPEMHQDKKSGPPKHIVAFKLDGALIFKMIELAVGKASQSININSKEEKIVKALEFRSYDITLHGISSDEADARRTMIEDFGYQIDVEPLPEPVDAR